MHIAPTAYKVQYVCVSSILNVVPDSASTTTNTNLEYLKEQLSLYLEKRQAVQADLIAKDQVGKVIGGTIGNAILEFISGSPNKP